MLLWESVEKKNNGLANFLISLQKKKQQQNNIRFL